MVKEQSLLSGRQRGRAALINHRRSIYNLLFIIAGLLSGTYEERLDSCGSMLVVHGSLMKIETHSNAPSSFIVCRNSKYFESVLRGTAESAAAAAPPGAAASGAGTGLDTGAKPKPTPTSGALGLGLAFVSSLLILSDAGTIEVNACASGATLLSKKGSCMLIAGCVRGRPEALALSFCAIGRFTTVELPVIVASFRPTTGAAPEGPAAAAPEPDADAACGNAGGGPDGGGRTGGGPEGGGSGIMPMGGLMPMPGGGIMGK